MNKYFKFILKVTIVEVRTLKIYLWSEFTILHYHLTSPVGSAMFCFIKKFIISSCYSPCGEGIKLNLLKTTMKTLNNKTVSMILCQKVIDNTHLHMQQKFCLTFVFLQPVQEKKPPRVRKPRGKQPDPEPVILTLSSDEEDSNSSMLSQVTNCVILLTSKHFYTLNRLNTLCSNT